jgi:nucleotide-binding universal stress UspA family protein
LLQEDSYMFKHILIPTDGSRLARKGIKSGVKLAATLGAKVTGVCVVAPFMPPVYGEAAVYVPAVSPQEYRKSSERAARKALAAVEIECQTAGVRYAGRVVTAQRPHEGILKAARAARVDAIAMASHGRGGLSGLLLGSETQRVLAHSKIPVLVTR